MGEENSDHEKSNVWKKTEWAGLICIFFILMVLIHMLWNSGADGEMADIRSVSSGWYQIVDEKEEALDLPAMVKADQDGKIMLYNNTLTPEDKNKVLSINGLQDQPEVWMGKQCLFWYEENDFLKNDQMKGKCGQMCGWQKIQEKSRSALFMKAITEPPFIYRHLF